MNSSKELIRQFIEVHNSVSAKEVALSDALVAINSDTYLTSIVPEEIDKMMWVMLTTIIGPERADWVSWWLYDAGQRASMIWDSNGVEIPVNNFEDLWEYHLK